MTNLKNDKSGLNQKYSFLIRYNRYLSRITPVGIVLISLISGILIWIIDATLDFLFFFENQKTFKELLITDLPEVEIFMRALILVFFVIFGIIISLHFAYRMKAEEELMQNEKNLRTTLKSIGDAVIAQTAYEIAGNKEKALDLGCTELITKPIRKEKIMEIIQKYIAVN